MAVKHASRKLSDSYFALVHQFPLTHLRDDDHLAMAQEMIDRLLQQEYDEGAEEYLNVLTDLVEAYEDEHYPLPDASESDVLRELMGTNRLSQAKLARMTGIAQSTLSAVLTGARSLTKGHITTLARVFNVSPAAFLPV